MVQSLPSALDKAGLKACERPSTIASRAATKSHSNTLLNIQDHTSEKAWGRFQEERVRFARVFAISIAILLLFLLNTAPGHASTIAHGCAQPVPPSVSGSPGIVLISQLPHP